MKHCCHCLLLFVFLLLSLCGCSKSDACLPAVLPVLSFREELYLEETFAYEEVTDGADLTVSQAESENPTANGLDLVTAPDDLSLQEEDLPVSYFRIHFLDVGQADAALIECDGAYMMIDAGNTGDSSFLHSYLKEQGIRHLDTLLITHGHEDHCGGAAAVLHAVTVDHILCSTTAFESEAFSDFKRYAAMQGLGIEVPKEGDSFQIGSAFVDILSCNIGSDENSNSIVTKITYGDTSFLMTGDAERDAEEHMLVAGYDLSSTVLKVGHHGSRNATTYPFLREVMPQFAVISAGADNEYGHPTEDVLSRLRDSGAAVYRTDLQGTILFSSDGTHVSVLPERNAGIDTIGLPDKDSYTDTYLLNLRSMKYHLESCEYGKEISFDNLEIFTGSSREIFNMGFVPCGACLPN